MEYLFCWRLLSDSNPSLEQILELAAEFVPFPLDNTRVFVFNIKRINKRSPSDLRNLERSPFIHHPQKWEGFSYDTKTTDISRSTSTLVHNSPPPQLSAVNSRPFQSPPRCRILPQSTAPLNARSPAYNCFRKCAVCLR